MGHVGMGWVMQEWDGSCRGWGGFVGLGWGGSCRGRVGYVGMACVKQGWSGVTSK